MTDYETISISDIAHKEHSRVDPSDQPNSIFSLYGFPAYDDGQKPEEKYGKNIGSQKYNVPDDCILVTKLNPRIKRVWKVRDSGENAVCSTEFVVLQPNEGISLDYLYAVLSSELFFSSMEQITGGTSGSHQRVNQSDILEYEFEAPIDDEDKNKIGNFIGNIDRKIELNREISELLEETARAIYESWFVEFEPYKEEYDFLSTELGPIPEHFQIKQLGEIIELQNGKKYKSEIKEQGDYKMYGANGVNGYISEYNTEPPCIIIGRVGSIGEIHRVSENSWVSDNCMRCWKSNDTSVNFIYFKLNDIDLKKLNRGSANPLIAQSDVKSQLIALPPKEELDRFESIVQSMFERKYTMEKENSNLQELREYLLPLLLSGGIQLSRD